MSPDGRGWSRPRATTDAELVAGARDRRLSRAGRTARWHSGSGSEVVGPEIDRTSELTERILPPKRSSTPEGRPEVGSALPDGPGRPAARGWQEERRRGRGLRRAAYPSHDGTTRLIGPRAPPQRDGKIGHAAHILGSAFNEWSGRNHTRSAATRLARCLGRRGSRGDRGEAAGQNHHCAHPSLAAPASVEDSGPSKLGRPAGALPTDIPAPEPRGRRHKLTAWPELVCVRVAVGDDANREDVSVMRRRSPSFRRASFPAVPSARPRGSPARLEAR